MRRFMLAVQLVLLLGLAACGASGETDVSPTNVPVPTAAPAETPEQINEQLITALTAQDSAAVLRLFDSSLATREAERERLTRDWATRQQPADATARCSPTLGPLTSHEATPATQAGETAKVRTALHHQAGDAWLEVELRQTPDGWRIVAWSSGNDCAR